jgi:hypothetical protein
MLIDYSDEFIKWYEEEYGVEPKGGPIDDLMYASWKAGWNAGFVHVPLGRVDY